MSKPKQMLISSDRLVPKAYRGVPATRAQRFYNWSDDGCFPPIESLEVPCDEWHIEMCIAGVCSCDGPEEVVRIVDQVRRDRRLAREAKAGWHNRKPQKRQKRAEPKPVKAEKPQKEDK